MEHRSEVGGASEAEKIAGQELRALRDARGWSQQEVARRMSAYGYTWHQTTVGRIEGGQRPLRVNELTDLATLFGVTVADLTTPKISLEAAQAEIAQLEPRLEAAKQRVADTEKEATSKREALEEAVYEANRINARLSYLQLRVAALKGGPG